MSKKQTYQKVLQNDYEPTDPSTGNAEFLRNLKTLVAEMEAGKQIKGGMVAILCEVAPEDAPADAPKGAEHQQELIFGAGAIDDLSALMGDAAYQFGQGLVRQHKEECDDEDCEFEGLGTFQPILKAVLRAATQARMAGQTKALQDLCEALKMIAESIETSMKNPLQELLKNLAGSDLPDGAKVFAVEGDAAKKLVASLVGKDVLPPELEALVREKLEEEAAEQADDTALPANTTFVSGDRKTKH
jgi:hypothetical protein